jgi:hypothetical protein
MATTHEYRSTDSGAPVLDGLVGSLVNVVRTCLKGTSGIAYGSKAAAGWTEPFSGTNKATFRNSLAAGGSGCHVRIDDNGSGGLGGREAFLRVFKTMSDVDTGTDPTPTVAQLTSGFTITKSDTASSAARPWILWADELTMHMWIGHISGSLDPAVSTTNCKRQSAWGGGDFESFLPGDSSPCFAYGNYASAPAVPTGSVGLFGRCASGNSNFSSPSLSISEGFSLMRGLSGSTGAVAARLLCMGSSTASSISNIAIGGSAGEMAESAPTTLEKFFIPALIGSEDGTRGRMRGLFVPMNNLIMVLAGVVYTSPIGRPSGSELVVMKGAINNNNTTTLSPVGTLVVERVLEWSV